MKEVKSLREILKELIILSKHNDQTKYAGVIVLLGQRVEQLKKEISGLCLNHRKFGKDFGLGDNDQVFIHWTDEFDKEFKEKIDEWVGV